MWRDYFPLGQIIGIDRNPDYAFEDRRIEVHTGDQGDTAFLLSLRDSRPPDIVLDDGGHLVKDQIASFEALWPVSLYVVEDAGGFVEYAKSLVGKAHVGFYNDIVTIEPWVEIHKIDSGG